MNTSKSKKSVKKKRSAHVRDTSDSDTHNRFSHILTSAFFGMAIGAICALILTVIGALLCYSAKDPDALIPPVAFAVLYLSSMVAGFAAVRKNRSSALLCGGFSGTLMMLLFLFCSIFLKGNAFYSFNFPLSLLLRFLMIVAAILGGYIGLWRKNTSHRPRKR